MGPQCHCLLAPEFCHLQRIPALRPWINQRHWRLLPWVPNAIASLPQSFATCGGYQLSCLELTQGTEGNCCGCPMPSLACPPQRFVCYFAYLQLRPGGGGGTQVYWCTHAWTENEWNWDFFAEEHVTYILQLGVLKMMIVNKEGFFF